MESWQLMGSNIEKKATESMLLLVLLVSQGTGAFLHLLRHSLYVRSVNVITFKIPTSLYMVALSQSQPMSCDTFNNCKNTVYTLHDQRISICSK